MIKIAPELNRLGILANQTQVVKELMDSYIIGDEEIKNANDELNDDKIQEIITENYGSFYSFLDDLFGDIDMEVSEFLLNYSDWNGKITEKVFIEIRDDLVRRAPFRANLENYTIAEIRNFTIAQVMELEPDWQKYVDYDNTVKYGNIIFDENNILQDFKHKILEDYEHELYLIDDDTEWVLVTSQLFNSKYVLLSELSIPYINTSYGIWLAFNNIYAFEAFVNHVKGN